MDTKSLDVFLRKIKLNEEPVYVAKQDQNRGMYGSIISFNQLMQIQKSNTQYFTLTQHGRFLPTPEHGHDCFEMMYIYDGSITHHIGEEKYALTKGSFCIIEPGNRHSTDVCGEGDIAVNFLMDKALFTDGFLSRISQNSLFFDFFSNILYNPTSGLRRHLIIHTGEDETVRKYATEILCEYNDPDLCTNDCIESLLALLFNSIFRYWRSNGGKKLYVTQENKADISYILRYIETNYKTVTLKDLAARFGYTPTYLSSLLTKNVGFSFMEIRHRISMQQASLLLINPTISVNQVAESVGISNMSFFYTLFHRYYGMTPAEYREKNLSKTVLSPVIVMNDR